MNGDDQNISDQPYPGMVISVTTRQDVVVMDPQRFLAAARHAYRLETPPAPTTDSASSTS